TGQMSLVAVHAADGVDEDEALRLAGAAEHASEHPLARAIARGAAERLGPLPEAAEFTNSEGLGIHAVVDGHAVLVRRPALLEQWSQPLPEELRAAQSAAEAHGRTAVAVAWDGAARAIVEVADTIKPTSAEAIAHLRQLGLKPVLLTGDNERVAH